MTGFYSDQTLRVKLYLKKVQKLTQTILLDQNNKQHKKEECKRNLFILDSLFNFLISGIRARVEHAFGQVMDETDSLGNADLLLLCQLVSQTTLPWSGMVYWHRLVALLEKKEQKTTCVICEASLHGGRILDAPFALQPDRSWISDADSDICKADYISFKSHLGDIRHCDAPVLL